jgi:hypothetical protein
MDLASENLSDALVERIRQKVQAYTPEGFVWFYYLTAPEPLPAHCVGWIYEYFEALKAGENLAVEAFRGSLKTTVITNFLTAYAVGCFPQLETVFVQSIDQMANDNSAFVADLIKVSPGFRLLFPSVRPDIPAGWGANGYEVMRNDIPYGQWRKLRSKTPTLMGAGYKSADVLGRHPTMHGILDDVNDHRNTRSARELNMVTTKVNKEIRPAFDRVKMQIDIFTPWVPGDVGQMAKQRSNTRVIRTPIYKLDAEGRLTDVPTWPEKFPEEKIEEMRQNSPPVEMAQMYYLDLAATGGQVLKREWLHFYPHDEIEKWPVVMAVDYASVAKHQELKGRDHFALSVVAVHPNGFGVLIDGYYAHVSRAEAESIGISWGVEYGDRLLAFGVEKQGKGEEYYNMMLRAAPFAVKDLSPGNISKGKRFEDQMAPLFKAGKMRVSNEPNNRFLDQFLNEWLSWDGSGHYFDDCLDAAYYAARLIKGFIKPTGDDVPGLFSRFKEATGNPLFKFARR